MKKLYLSKVEGKFRLEDDTERTFKDFGVLEDLGLYLYTAHNRDVDSLKIYLPENSEIDLITLREVAKKATTHCKSANEFNDWNEVFPFGDF
ncbi:hypothetical protein KGV55_01385 [Candidatus Gracilibacteria bacterium]|nr:hypothetical protein [Candidatus Gracilibacteria bacterium]